ncbi:GTP pyrophosphokinase [Clostridium paraputrificum]|uniref:GTP pyrophosphokinase n=1 Tax=Clostridium paraputrificum TaxID=29363 RepID=UPI003D32C338
MMTLKMFGFIDEIISELEKNRGFFEDVSEEIEEYFEGLVKGKCEGYINISTRVKSSSSLKEKIIRNNYYNKNLSPRELIYGLSDLIGVRIECRFIKDEEDLYQIVKNHFELVNKNDDRIILDVKGVQPQKQKNGYDIYRIDGYYKYDSIKVPFELQIKSLVDVFWGEIEHKIIYKNNSYRLMDSYLKDTMNSIKKNLIMIDNQLYETYNQFNEQGKNLYSESKSKFEMILSKIIYDAYALKMKNAIGFVVDFKKLCDTIIKYFLRNEDAYGDMLIMTLERLDEIKEIDTKFDEEIKFERDINFKDDFCEKVGKTILKSINEDFQWNLFFRIIFEIEVKNNAEDFEAFIEFYRDNFSRNSSFLKLNSTFGINEGMMIKNEFMHVISTAFADGNSINFVIDNNIKNINHIISNEIDKICNNIESYEEWESNKEIYLKKIYFDILEKNK